MNKLLYFLSVICGFWYDLPFRGVQPRPKDGKNGNENKENKVIKNGRTTAKDKNDKGVV
jgi:hypothetical protein